MLSWILTSGIVVGAGAIASLVLSLHRKVKRAAASEMRKAEESPAADLFRSQLSGDAPPETIGDAQPLTASPVLTKLEDTFRKELERLTAFQNKKMESSQSELLKKEEELRALRTEKEELEKQMERRLRELPQTGPRIPTSAAETERSDQEKKELLQRIAELESLLSLTREQMQTERAQWNRAQEDLKQKLAAEKISVETELAGKIKSLGERIDSEHDLLEEEKKRVAEAQVQKGKLAELKQSSEQELLRQKAEVEQRLAQLIEDQAAERALTVAELKTLRNEAVAVKQREKNTRDQMEQERQRMLEELEKFRRQEKLEREALLAENESLKEKIRNLAEESALEAKQREEEFRRTVDRRSRELEETVRQLQTQVETRQAETLKLKKQLTERLMTLERAKEIHLKLREELLQKEQEIAATDKLKEELEKQTIAGLSRKENEIAKLQAYLAEKDRRIEIFEAEFNSSEVKILDLEEKLKEAAATVQTRSQEMKALEKEKNGKIDQWKQEVARREAQAEQYRRKIEQYVKESKQREGELMSLTDLLKQKEDAVQILGDSAREKEEQYHRLDIRLKEREIELRTLAEDMEEERKQRSALQKSLAENEESMQKMEALLTEYQEENAKLRNSGQEREAAVRTLEAELQKRIQESSVAASAVNIDGGLIQTLRKAIQERDDRIRTLEAQRMDVESEREHVLESLLQAKEEAVELRSRLPAEAAIPAPQQQAPEGGPEPAEQGRAALSRLFSLKILLLLAAIPVALVIVFSLARKERVNEPAVAPEKWEQAIPPGNEGALPGSSKQDSVLVPDREPSGVSLRRMAEITDCLSAWVREREQSSLSGGRGDLRILLRDVTIAPKEDSVEVTLLEYQRTKTRTEIARKRLNLVQGPQGLEIRAEEILPFRKETKPLS